MGYYLCRWTGSGERFDPFTPEATATDWALVADLRPDPKTAEGHALVWTGQPAEGRRALLLGDDVDAPLPALTGQLVAESLGVAPFPPGTSLRLAVRRLLTDDAGPSSWPGIVPGVDGLFAAQLGPVSDRWAA